MTNRKRTQQDAFLEDNRERIKRLFKEANKAGIDNKALLQVLKKVGADEVKKVGADEVKMVDDDVHIVDVDLNVVVPTIQRSNGLAEFGDLCRFLNREGFQKGNGLVYKWARAHCSRTGDTDDSLARKGDTLIQFVLYGEHAQIKGHCGAFMSLCGTAKNYKTLQAELVIYLATFCSCTYVCCSKSG